jgi:HAD superfamily hydrolase (TIGR01509 family)
MLDLPGEGRALMDELHALVMDELAGGVPPRPGALELLEAVRAAGVPAGLASNSPREFVDRALAAAGLGAERFGVVLAGDEVPAQKPAPDIYLAACAALGADPARAAALEDTATGVAAAAAAGMLVIGVPYFAGTPLPGAAIVADSLADESVWRALGLR